MPIGKTEEASGGKFYDRLLRPLLFSFDPEQAHHLALGALRFASSTNMGVSALGRMFPLQEQPLRLFGLTFPNRVGLAAGFDKNGVAVPALAALGFGFIEIGTVTAQPQPGNPRPRVFRYPAQQALINRLGFNNDGADVVSHHIRKLRVAHRWPLVPVGINLGKSKVTPLAEAAEDYRYSFKRLAPIASYIVLNVSSPNTPGLRALQEQEALVQLLQVVREENHSLSRPVLLKIAPDVTEADLEGIIAACEAHGVAGIIATNTTLDHSSIAMARKPDQEGGLSGAPLHERSTALIRFIRARTQLPIIASGGVMDADSARAKFDAGAQLVQIYTGFVYRGPRLVREIATLS